MAGPSSTLKRYGNNPDRFEMIEDLQNLTPPALSNDIHPIFARENFPDDIDYTSLEDSLRLTSHFLERALPAFHSILLGNPEVKESPFEEYLRIGILPDPLEELTLVQQAEVRAMLLRLAKVVTFKTTESLSYDFALAECHLGTRCTDGTVPGYCSTIAIGQDISNSVANSSPDIIESTWNKFQFARALIHELGHAAGLAAAWSIRQFREGWYDLVFLNTTNELGFEVEDFLFGGAINLEEFSRHPVYSHHGVSSSLEGRIFLRLYPQQYLVENYGGELLAVLPDENGEPRGFPDERPRIVLLRRIAEMFSDVFWAEGRSTSAFEEDQGTVPEGLDDFMRERSARYEQQVEDGVGEGEGEETS